jgi:hypothetical protein
METPVKYKRYFCFDPPLHYSIPSNRSSSQSTHHPNSPAAEADDELGHLYRLPRPTARERAAEHHALDLEVATLRRDVAHFHRIFISLGDSIARAESSQNFIQIQAESGAFSRRRPRKPHSVSRRIVRRGFELDGLTDDEAELAASCSGHAIARLGFATAKQRAAVLELRAQLAEGRARLDEVQRQAAAVREGEAYEQMCAAGAAIEALDGALAAERETRARLRAEAEALDRPEAPDWEVSILEREFAQADAARAAAQRRYAALIRRQRAEAAQLEGLLGNMARPERADRRRLLIGPFRERVDTRALQAVFARFGGMELVNVVVTGLNPRRHLGQVQFFRSQDAARALAAVNNTDFMGQRIRVRWADKQPGDEEMGSTTSETSAT